MEMIEKVSISIIKNPEKFPVDINQVVVDFSAIHQSQNVFKL